MLLFQPANKYFVLKLQFGYMLLIAENRRPVKCKSGFQLKMTMISFNFHFFMVTKLRGLIWEGGGGDFA